ncbi:unnamed protein product [Echinostoma caproni]|uniref:Membrane-associated protein n=1 Tax=Echinostoma caproni TaxID=27848 RepID=A0A183AE20_9TREM|nr:unnamed protein product [Echinostoma caproni]
MLNAFGLILLALYVIFRPHLNMDEVLGSALTNIPGVVAWSILTTSKAPRLHPHWQYEVWFHLIITQAAIILIYQLFLRPKQFVYLGRAIQALRKMNWTMIMRKTTQEMELSIKTSSTPPYGGQILRRTSTPASALFHQLSVSLDSVSSLELDQSDNKLRAVNAYVS